MEEKILQALKNKYANLGLGDNILKGFAKKLAKTTTEETEIDNAVEGVEDDLKIWQSINDQHRTEISTLKKQLKTVKQPKDEPKDDDDKDDSGKDRSKDDVPAWAKAMLSELSALKGEKVQTTRKSVLEEKIKTAPDAVKNKILKDFGRMNFQNDEDFEAFVQETEADLPEITKAITKPTTKPLISIGTADVSQTRVDAAIKEVAAKNAATLNQNKKQ